MAHTLLGTLHPSNRLKSLVGGVAVVGAIFGAIFGARSAGGQVNNPYGRIDSGDASVEALRFSVGGSASPATLEVFSSFEVPDRTPLLEGLLEGTVSLQSLSTRRTLEAAMPFTERFSGFFLRL